ncbi:hypothetical protein FPZ12_030095 [Amycolatopsis acidicola]|uniref:Glycosyltransferase RgtA/B/C/D-like domain-containing protein n=1 Tax=Amycolatopsis acidicola TaxID=2596893 RepID=A0A5N0UUM7_9PSEU|nr:hypothetical protein [Amycolatopsis acidicola]KAA9155274.1 hypothetical protein FPZ12_030095 [Amycolatopsis acidicola]
MTQLAQSAPETAEPAREKRRRRPAPAFWVALLALALGWGFVAGSLIWNGGHLFAPLDDVYIHLQYGRQLGLGEFFRFNTGDEISAGASSVLYSFLLGGVYAIGVHGIFFQYFAIGFGIACFAASAALTTLLGTRLISRTAGTWAGVLVAVSGPLLWGSASGMEVGLVMVLVTGLLLCLVAEQPAARFRFFPVVAALLALARTEGLIFAAALTCAALWTLWTHRALSGIPAMLRRALWCLLPFAAGAAQLLFYKLATGTTSANGVQSKSFLYDKPVFYPGEFLDRTTATLRTILGHFLGLGDQDYAFPGALLFFCVGACFLLLERGRRLPVAATVLGLAAAVVSLSTLDTAIFHELRYFHPFLPVFVVFTVAGFHGLTRVIARERTRRFVLHAALAVVLGFSLVALPMWGVRFARAGAGIGSTDVSYAAWIETHLPKGSTVAVKDVGAVAYLGGHDVVDLLGLGTNGFAKAANNGIGSLYEQLRHLPAAERPGYFATYDSGPGPGMAPLRDTGVLEQPGLATFAVQTPADLRGIVSVPFKEFTIARADWSLVANADIPPVPGDPRDYVNVAYLGSEQAHGYEYLAAQDGMQPWSVVARVDDVVSGGRTIIGGEAFTVDGLTPGQDAVLTARANVRGGALQVLVDGAPAGTWRRAPGPAPWQHYSVTIPGNAIGSSSVRIELRDPTPGLSPFPDYTSYGYWITQ